MFMPASTPFIAVYFINGWRFVCSFRWIAVSNFFIYIFWNNCHHWDRLILYRIIRQYTIMFGEHNTFAENYLQTTLNESLTILIIITLLYDIYSSFCIWPMNTLWRIKSVYRLEWSIRMAVARLLISFGANVWAPFSCRPNRAESAVRLLNLVICHLTPPLPLLSPSHPQLSPFSQWNTATFTAHLEYLRDFNRLKPHNFPRNPTYPGSSAVNIRNVKHTAGCNQMHSRDWANFHTFIWNVLQMAEIVHLCTSSDRQKKERQHMEVYVFMALI